MVPRKELFAALLILLFASFFLFFLRQTTHKQQQHLRILAGSAVDQHWRRIQDLKNGIDTWYGKFNALKGLVGSGKVPYNSWVAISEIYDFLISLDGKLSTQRGLRSSDTRLWLSQKLNLWGAENGVGLQLMNARTAVNCWSTFHPRGPAPAPAPAPAGPTKVTQSQTQGDDAQQAQIVKELERLNEGTTSTAASPNAGDLRGPEISLNGNPSK